MHRNTHCRLLSKKVAVKFPVTKLSYSMAKIACLDNYGNAFSQKCELEASPVKGQSLLQKDDKRSKGKIKLKKISQKSLSVPFVILISVLVSKAKML